MKYRITKIKEKPFIGSDGETVPYFWYKALRLNDNVNLEFGSTQGGRAVGTDHEITLERRESNTGKLVWREIKSV